MINRFLKWLLPWLAWAITRLNCKKHPKLNRLLDRTLVRIENGK